VTLTIAVVDSLKALDPSRPIREADIGTGPYHFRRGTTGNLAIFAAIRLAYCHSLSASRRITTSASRWLLAKRSAPLMYGSPSCSVRIVCKQAIRPHMPVSILAAITSANQSPKALKNYGLQSSASLANIYRDPARLVALTLKTIELIKSPGSIVPPGECHDICQRITT
jgi:hypothetical protein